MVLQLREIDSVADERESDGVAVRANELAEVRVEASSKATEATLMHLERPRRATSLGSRRGPRSSRHARHSILVAHTHGFHPWTFAGRYTYVFETSRVV